MEQTERPLGVTILAIVAGILGLLAILTSLNWLGLVPWLGQGPSIRTFNLWYAFIYALLAWFYIWLARMLWQIDASAWIFLALIAVFNLLVGFFTIIITNMPMTDLTTLSMVLNGLVLVYIMLPGTRDAFERKWAYGK